jgi:glycosyltransferase involved in cell wall biosynthesis
MSRLRVLMISGEYPPMEGGVADFTAILSRAMAADAEVHVLTSLGPMPGQGRATTASSDIAVEDGVIVHRRMDAWSWLPLRRAVSELLTAHDIDVVNIQYQTAAYGMHPAINLLPMMERRVPMVVTFHDLLVPYLLPKAGALREWVNLTLARRCRAAIVTNAQDHRRLAAVRGIPRLERIPIGSNISTALPADYDRAAWRERWGLPDESVVLCYFGFLNASKGGEDLVHALHQLVNDGVGSNAMDARLLMIGGAVGASDPTNRAYLTHVRALIAELGLEERVIWTGHLPDAEVSACFAIADVCLLPYRDGVSFRRGSLMAALAHGMPIISTYPPMEMLGDEIPSEAMWLVPPSDPVALADAVRSLMRGGRWAQRMIADDLRQRLGAGAQALSAAFGWDQIAERTLRLLTEVAHG